MVVAHKQLCIVFKVQPWCRTLIVFAEEAALLATTSTTCSFAPIQVVVPHRHPPQVRVPGGWGLQGGAPMGDAWLGFDEDGSVFLFPSVPMREPWLLYSVAKARVGFR